MKTQKQNILFPELFCKHSKLDFIFPVLRYQFSIIFIIEILVKAPARALLIITNMNLMIDIISAIPVLGSLRKQN